MKSLMDGFAAYKSTTYSSQDVYINTRSVDILNKQVFELVINRIGMARTWQLKLIKHTIVSTDQWLNLNFFWWWLS